MKTRQLGSVRAACFNEEGASWQAMPWLEYHKLRFVLVTLEHSLEPRQVSCSKGATAISSIPEMQQGYTTPRFHPAHPPPESWLNNFTCLGLQRPSIGRE